MERLLGFPRCFPGYWAIGFGLCSALRPDRPYSKHKTLVVLGRALMNAPDAERQARALFYDQETPLDLGHSYEKEPIGFRVRDGARLGVEAPRHPDPIVEAQCPVSLAPDCQRDGRSITCQIFGARSLVSRAM